MKKILSLFVTMVIFMFACGITSCTNSTTSTKNGAVKLIGIQSSVYDANAEYEKEKVSKLSVARLPLNMADVEVEEPTTGDDVILPSEGESSSESEKNLLDGTDYIIIYKNQTIINFTINLSNPQDYYIMDFTLSAENEDVEYLTTEGTWKSIKDRSIRWISSDNETCTYHLRLLNENATPSKIKILSMYYSDRNDGTNKTAVNLNNKETYTIYKVNSDVEKNVVELTDVENIYKADSMKFKIKSIENANIKKIYDRDTDAEYSANEEGFYILSTHESTLAIDYEYQLEENIVLKSTKMFDIREFDILSFGSSSFENFEEFGDKQYFCVGTKFDGTGAYNNIVKISNEEGNFIIYKSKEMILFEVPNDHKDDMSWCKNRSFTFLGNTFVLKDLINKNF